MKATRSSQRRACAWGRRGRARRHPTGRGVRPSSWGRCRRPRRRRSTAAPHGVTRMASTMWTRRTEDILRLHGSRVGMMGWSPAAGRRQRSDVARRHPGLICDERAGARTSLLKRGRIPCASASYRAEMARSWRCTPARRMRWPLTTFHSSANRRGDGLAGSCASVGVVVPSDDAMASVGAVTVRACAGSRPHTPVRPR